MRPSRLHYGSKEDANYRIILRIVEEKWNYGLPGSQNSCVIKAVSTVEELLKPCRMAARTIFSHLHGSFGVRRGQRSRLFDIGQSFSSINKRFEVGPFARKRSDRVIR